MGESLLLTGIAGLIGSRIALEALKAGHKVHGIVLNTQEKELMETSSVYDPYRANLTLTMIPNIRPEGVYDDVSKGKTALIHVASPIPMPGIPNVYENITLASFAGVKNILSAAEKTLSVRRVVITSSMTAIFDPAKPEHLFTAYDAPLTPSISPNEEDPVAAYLAAKYLGLAHINKERARGTRVDIVALLPAYVLGPKLLARKRADYFWGSTSVLFDPLLGRDPVSPWWTASIHVEDVALAHLAAIKDDVPVGNYFLSADGQTGMQWDKAIEFAQAQYPGKFDNAKIAPNLPFMLDTTEAERVFWKFKTMEVQVKDTVDGYLSLLD